MSPKNRVSIHGTCSEHLAFRRDSQIFLRYFRILTHRDTTRGRFSKLINRRKIFGVLCRVHLSAGHSENLQIQIPINSVVLNTGKLSSVPIFTKLRSPRKAGKVPSEVLSWASPLPPPCFQSTSQFCK